MDGRLVSGKLILDAQPLLGVAPTKTPGSKPVKYAPLPAFDQLTEYVTQEPPIDGKTAITVGVKVNTCTVSKEVLEPIDAIEAAKLR